ncbi:hypothetical protein BJV82DRAFT_716024 [Fennellomyces sp. T-0311]|nr:hypothetical protein BJV82DRAFT_716024 [Fennellomyces sp. T-0311]
MVLVKALPFFGTRRRINLVSMQSQGVQPNADTWEDYIEMNYDYDDHENSYQGLNNVEQSENGPVNVSTSEQDNTQDRPRTLREEKVGGEIWSEPGTTSRAIKPVNIPEVDMMLAEFALDCNISNAKYSRLVDIVRFAQHTAIESPLNAIIRYSTLESVFENLKKNQSTEATLPFTVEIVDMANIPELKDDERIIDAIGKPVLIYRNICHLAERIFSHPLFDSATHIQPSIVTDSDGDRVYSDLYSGNWWINMQAESSEISSGSMVLGLMLASDKTVVTGNSREQAWPLYLKLANTSSKFRDKGTLRGNRLLAYFPVIESKIYGSTDWFKKAKKVIFHYCMGRILAPFQSKSPYIMQGPDNKIYSCIPALASYSADMEEQHMLTLCKHGCWTLRGCPRCLTTTSNFNNNTGNSVDRTTDNMQALVRKAQVYLANRQSKHAKDLSVMFSFHPLENAFWNLPQPQFNIYDALLVDDLHQIGGVYKHLLKFVEGYVREHYGGTAITKINERAASLPQYQKHHSFRKGFLYSSLINPTYTELRSHMTIILPCCHDYLPTQACLCLRSFLDFVMLATAKEHTDESLLEMEEHLTSYYDYSPIFQAYSKSRFTFPKNHMLQKYAKDICNRGAIGNYSTMHSEHLHILEAKKPAKQTNRRFDSMVQMARFVEKRDLLFDIGTTWTAGIWKQRAMKTVSETTKTRNSTQWILSSPEARIDTVEEISKKYHNFLTLLRAFLDVEIEGNPAATELRNWPSLDASIVEVFKTLTIEDFYESDGTPVDDKIRTHDLFFGRKRKDFALFDYGERPQKYGQVLMMFKCVYKGKILYLALAQEYVSLNEEHDTGLEVLAPALTYNYHGLFVAPITRIMRSISVLPDFSSTYTFSNPLGAYAYGRYLLNHDADRASWTNKNGILPVLEQLVGWEVLSEANPAESDEDMPT